MIVGRFDSGIFVLYGTGRELLGPGGLRVPYLVCVNARGAAFLIVRVCFGLGLRGLRDMGIPRRSSIACWFRLVHAAVRFAVGSMTGISGDTLLDDA